MKTDNKWSGLTARGWIGCLLGFAACQGPSVKPQPAQGPQESPTPASPTVALPEPQDAPSEVVPPSAPSDLAPDLDAPEPDSLRNTRRWQLAHQLRESPGWNLYESEHYFISTPVDSPLLLEGAKRRLQAMRLRLQQDFPPPSSYSTAPAPLLRIFPNLKAFRRAGGQSGTTAYWDRIKNTLVCFDAGDDVARAKSTWPGLQHVLVHEYLESVLQIKDAPKWLLFGLAANYEALRFTASPAGGRWNEPDREDLNRALSEAVAADGPMALERLLEFDAPEFFGTNEFGSGAYRNLVLARAFVAYCQSSPETEGVSHPTNFLKNYTGALGNGLGPATALARALGESDLRALNRSWRAWIELRTGRDLPPGL